MAGFFKQILTFGAAGRIESAKADYDAVLAEARSTAERVERRRAEAGAVLEALVEVKRACIPVLGRVKSISRHLGVRPREFQLEQAAESTPELAVARIQHTLDAAGVAMSAAKGIAAGASTAMGAWALAGAYGTASTGTALSALSGIAAQNATLAWFSGGSLAAGGGGIAGGTAVLGGIVAVPALVVMAYLAHSSANKQIAEMESKAMELEHAIDEMKKLELVIDLAEQRARELIEVIGKGREAFEHQLRQVQRALYPLGWLSCGWRWLRKRFGGDYFVPAELERIQGLLQIAAEFAGLLDQPVFEPDGAVRREAT